MPAMALASVGDLSHAPRMNMQEAHRAIPVIPRPSVGLCGPFA